MNLNCFSLASLCRSENRYDNQLGDQVRDGTAKSYFPDFSVRQSHETKGANRIVELCICKDHVRDFGQKEDIFP
jgi:hypothetical protein